MDKPAQTKMTQWQKKARVINQYFAEVGSATRVRKQVRQTIVKPCDWCERFLEAGCLHCLNCGSNLEKIRSEKNAE